MILRPAAHDELFTLVSLGTLALQCRLCSALVASGEQSDPNAREQHRLYHEERGELPKREPATEEL